MSQTEHYSPEASFSDYSEKLLQRNMVSSTVLCLVGTKSITQVRNIFPQGFKNQISTYPASKYGLGTWEESLIIEKNTSIGAPEREAFNPYF